MRVEPRDDVEVEGRRQKLLKACNGFRDHDEHLKKFFIDDPQKTQSESFVRFVRLILRDES